MQRTGAILSSVACTALRNCLKLLHKGKIFEKKNLKYKMCVASFSTTSVSNIFNSKKNRAKYDQICTMIFM